MGLLAIAVIVVVEGVCWALAFSGPPGTPAFWLLTCTPTIVFGVASLVYGWKKGRLPTWLGLRASDLAWGVLVAGIQYALAYAAATWLLPRIPGGTAWLTQLYAHLGSTATRQAHPILSLLGLLLTCGLEEIMWRGFATDVVQPRLSARAAFVVQILANTVLYVPMAVIMKNPIIPCGALVGALATGILAVRRGGRLPGPILGHGLLDFAVVILWPLA